MRKVAAFLAATVLFAMLVGACGVQQNYDDPTMSTIAITEPTTETEPITAPLLLSVSRYNLSRFEPYRTNAGSGTMGIDVGESFKLEAQTGVSATITVLSFDEDAVTVRFETENMVARGQTRSDAAFDWTATIPFGEEYALNALIFGGGILFYYTFTKNPAIGE